MAMIHLNEAIVGINKKPIRKLWDLKEGDTVYYYLYSTVNKKFSSISCEITWSLEKSRSEKEFLIRNLNGGEYGIYLNRKNNEIPGRERLEGGVEDHYIISKNKSSKSITYYTTVEDADWKKKIEKYI